MAARTKSRATSPPASARSLGHRGQDIAAIGCTALAGLIGFALYRGDAGLLGQTLGQALTALFGRGAWGMPVLLLIIAFGLIRGRGVGLAHLSLGLTLTFLSALGALAAPFAGDFFDPSGISVSGGFVGALVGWAASALAGAAKPILLAATGLIGVVLCVDVPIRTMIARSRQMATVVRQRTIERPRRTPVDAPLPKPRFPVEAPVRPIIPVTEAQPDAQPVSAPKKPIDRNLTRKAPEPTFEADFSEPKEGYQLPPTNLLAEAVLQPKRSQAEMQQQIETLEGTLEQFGIDAQVVEVATGPTVTRYEIQLGPGVRVNRITALADNIAMDMAASQVRVEAPIPGKAAIGVEVPNAVPSMVTLRELCEDVQFKSNSSRLYVALGKDVSGKNRYADLAKMPHLLIGGATNSGKSIGLATLITSLLMRNTPKDVRLVMIDPKRVELTLFDHVPHLMCPVIKDVKEAPGVLRAVWREMDRRYDLFSEAGVRNIDGWNAKASSAERLPYIVVIIDELADLMIQAAAEIETVIVRLAQLARAVGIHIVIATQRPSVDVITGLIKANIPSRIAFSVASHIDSRTILDGKGAEALIGKGDMLFSPIDANKPVRIQGCFVSEKEIEAVCRFWREQERPTYDLEPVDAEMVADPKKERGEFNQETDPLYEDAVRWAADRGEASTSMLQRKFSIGFQRASRLLDMMEERGIVSRQNGPRPRDVLIAAMEVESVLRGVPTVTYDVGRTLADEE